MACVDSALTLVPREVLTEAFSEATIAHQQVVDECRPGSDSGYESIVRQRLAAIGIVLIQQVHLPGVGRVDGRIARTRVIVEIDGRKYHDDPQAAEEDRRCGAELAALGYTRVQLSTTKITSDWPWCVRMVCGAIARFRDAA